MSATNRTIEAEVLTVDIEDSPKARRKFEDAVDRLTHVSGFDRQHVRGILELARKDRKKSKRSKGDFYETPAWCIDEIVPYLSVEGEPIIVDAGAGTGAIAARLSEVNPRAEIIGFEKQPELTEKARARGLLNAEFHTANFLTDSLAVIQPPDIVIMNPPFGFALQFVERALRLVRRGGTVCTLLRLNWLAGKCRRDFLKKHLPDVHVLTRRPSFTGHGTDATEYAWMVWSPESKGRINLLPCNHKIKRKPRAARKAKNAAKAEG